MLLYMSNAAFHLAGDGKVCICGCVFVCVDMRVHLVC